MAAFRPSGAMCILSLFPPCGKLGLADCGVQCGDVKSVVNLASASCGCSSQGGWVGWGKVHSLDVSLEKSHCFHWWNNTLLSPQRVVWLTKYFKSEVINAKVFFSVLSIFRSVISFLNPICYFSGGIVYLGSGWSRKPDVGNGF